MGLGTTNMVIGGLNVDKVVMKENLLMTNIKLWITRLVALIDRGIKEHVSDSEPAVIISVTDYDLARYLMGSLQVHLIQGADNTYRIGSFSSTPNLRINGTEVTRFIMHHVE